MTSSPILRSAALQRALAVAPVRGSAASAATPSTSGSFAVTLSRAEARVGVNIQRPRTATPVAPHPGVSAVPFKTEITAAAQKYGLDPALLAGLVKAESNFNPKAQSGVGAKGLTQLMDATARGLGVTDGFDPAQNLDAGAKFLSGLLKQFHGDESLALAAYNAGPGAVQKYGRVPPYEETRRYVPKVLGYTAQFRRTWADSTGP